MRAPFHPHEVNSEIPRITNAIWPTEEYAINDLISVCRIQTRLVITPPQIAILLHRGLILNIRWGNIKVIRKIPYPPSFSSNPARIIDPAIGASTWALGNQRWKINIGILTKNARTVIVHQIYAIGVRI